MRIRQREQLTSISRALPRPRVAGTQSTGTHYNTAEQTHGSTALLASVRSSSAVPATVLCHCGCAQFGHNPSNHSILLRSALFTVVLLCADSVEHREWRQALLKLQTEINDNEEQRSREAEARQRMEEARRMIAERKQRKLERRRSAETPLSSSPRHQGSSDNTTGAAAPSSPESISSQSAPFDASSPSTPPPPQPVDSLLSDVAVPLSSSSDSPSMRSETSAIATTQRNELNQPRQQSLQQQQQQQEQQAGSLSETDEDGSSEYDDSAAQIGNGPLISRRASTRSMSLDESEMSQMRAGRIGRLQPYGADGAYETATPPGNSVSMTSVTPATGGEHRKLTDPLPSSQLSATPSMYPSVVQQQAQREKLREDEERVRRAEEKAAAYLRAQKSKAYVKLFSLPESEELICDYSCAVQRSILLHGRMYVSEHFVCFFSSIFSHKTSIVLPMDDVLFVASAKVALVFDNSLKVKHSHTRDRRESGWSHCTVLDRHMREGELMCCSLPSLVVLCCVVQLYVQVGPLPVPVRLDDSQQQDVESIRLDRVRKSSTSSDRSTTSVRSHSSSSAAADEESEAAAGEVGEEVDEAESTAVTAPSGPRFMLSTANTMTASFTLSQEQIAYLISVNHPNIQHHFFASFLTRDHALQLLDGILKQKHGRDGFTSLSSPSPLPTPAVSSTNSPASQTRSISNKDSSGGSAEKEKKTFKKMLPTAQPVASSAADSATTLSSHGLPSLPSAAATSTDDQHAVLLPASASQELPTSLSFSTPTQHSTVIHNQLPSSHSLDVVSAFHHSSRSSSASSAVDTHSTPIPPHSPAGVDDASQTDGGDEWASEDDQPATLVASLDFGGPDMQPPLGDFNDVDDSLLLDTTFDMDATLFFHLFYADNAPFSLHSYHAQRATDSEFKLTRWRDIVEEPPVSAVLSDNEAKRREVEGDLLRRLSYRMQFVTPVGPPVTRVHRVQRWYAADKQHTSARLDSCSVTPDIMFGDQVVILERMYVERLGGEQSAGATAESTAGQVRVRVHGGVRFKSRPWKMKPFIGLIQQRSREDVKAGVEQWEQFVKRRMQEEPDKVEACKRRVASLRGKSILEQLLPKCRPANMQPRAVMLSSASRPQPPQPAPSHDTVAASSGSSTRYLLFNRGNSAVPPLATSSSTITSASPTAPIILSAQSTVQPSPASRALSVLSSAFTYPANRSAAFAGSAASDSHGSTYWLSVRPSVVRLLPSAWSSPLVGRMDAASAAVARLDGPQRVAWLCFTLSLLIALLLGPDSRMFAVTFLLFAAILAVSAFSRLSAISASLDESQQQLHTVQQLLMAIKLEQERNGAEQKESTTTKKRPVSNVVIDPTHFK